MRSFTKEIDGKYYHKTSCIHTCNGCNDPVLVDEARWVSGAYWHLCCLQYQCHNCGNSINPQQVCCISEVMLNYYVIL